MIIFVGVAGSGKSTQGKMLAKDLGCTYLSTGELLRNHADGQIQKVLVKGDLIQDDRVIDVLYEALTDESIEGEFILDGFPRSVHQAEWLIEQQKKGLIKLKVIFHLKADEETIVHRLLDRHRPDDHIKAINKRLDEYHQTISPIINKFKELSIKVIDINAEQSSDEVHKEIMNYIRSLEV